MWQILKLKCKRLSPIKVFVRHCYSSSASAHKVRFKHFSRKLCYQNLMDTWQESKHVHFTFFLDRANAASEKHFLKEQNRFPVIEITAGTEGRSFLYMLDYVLKQKYTPDTLIYFLEDDYLHKPHWEKVLREGFSISCADYVTLYDHKDKYALCAYPDLTAYLFHTQTCHWRTTPSTTNTYAMRFETLQKDSLLHREFSSNREISADHDKFCALSQLGRVLISSVPGWSTHAEPAYASPCTDWQRILDLEFAKKS